jgi:hypothetical protein
MRWLHALGLLALANAVHAKACALKVLGHGRDDTDQVGLAFSGIACMLNGRQVLAAVSACGKNGHIILAPGTYNITRCAHPVQQQDVALTLFRRLER